MKMLTNNDVDLDILYSLIAGMSSDVIARFAPHVAAISDEAYGIGEWLGTLGDDADTDAVAAIVAPGVLSVARCDDEDDEDEEDYVEDNSIYRCRAYVLLLDGDPTPVTWSRTSVGYVSHGGRETAGTVVVELDECSERAPAWVSALVSGADDYPNISDSDVQEAEEASYGDMPTEDDEGEWAVIGMDGVEHGRYATPGECHEAIAHEAARFSASPRSSGGAYLPRSVCHLPCGVVRAGQWSTKYYSPGCTHAEDVCD